MTDVRQSSWIAVAKTSELVPNQPKAVTANDVRVALIKTEGADGGIHAIEDLCTHDDGPLAEGAVEGGAIECPRHGARFDIKTGAALCMPAVTPIRSFPVRVTGDQVEIQIPE